MKPSDRRFTSRVSVRVPVRIQVRKSTLPPEERESVNLSEKGIYFVTDMPLSPGAALELFFTMPPEITGRAAPTEWKCMGHVVHAELIGGMAQRIGVGVMFDYYEEIGSTAKSPRVRQLAAS
ncbi:MAG TPA: PilZ domain-containing protein [Candidatus Limnocylindrales bacterium]|nr:PilZ domain-containing protein [Candidatus Limnocylindrales bacterium]